jgi:hypothetical protein
MQSRLAFLTGSFFFCVGIDRVHRSAIDLAFLRPHSPSPPMLNERPISFSNITWVARVAGSALRLRREHPAALSLQERQDRGGCVH